MKSILSIHIGQCGSFIGSKFWDTIQEEHKNSETLPLNILEEREDKYIPRGIFADMDSRAIDTIRSRSPVYSADSFLWRKYGTGNNYAIARNAEEFSQEIQEQVRKKIELSEGVDSFIFTYGSGGGTGSGLSASLIQSLSAEYHTTQIGCTVFPNPFSSSCVLEPYNCVLGFQQANQGLELTIPMDNFSLADFCIREQGLPRPTFMDANKLIANSLSALTAGTRFRGMLNYSIRKVATNLVPFPSNSLVMCSVATKGNLLYDINNQLFGGNFLNGIGMDMKSCLAAAALYRGNLSTYELEQSLATICDKNSGYYVPWLPNNTFIGMTYSEYEKSACMLANSASIITLLQQVVDNFTAMFRKRAYIHWYTREGVEEMEFTDAETYMLDIISFYDSHTIDDNDDLSDEE